jgi:hypothetical protein
MILNRYLSTGFPLLRTAEQGFGDTSYKHLTPSGVKAGLLRFA